MHLAARAGGFWHISTSYSRADRLESLRSDLHLKAGDMHQQKGFLLASSLVLICATEFSLRTVCGLGSPPLILREAASGYEFRPNQHLHRFGKRIEYNSEGLRSEPLRTLTADSIRVLCLGDSVTNGGALTDQSATFPYQLEAELARSGLNVQALNASAGGWDPANEAGFVRDHGLFGSKEVVWELGTHDLFGGRALPAPSDPNFPEHAPFSATKRAVDPIFVATPIRRSYG